MNKPINLACIECRSIIGGKATPVSPLGTHGVNIYALSNGLYLPQHQVVICDGFVPLEGVVHSNHLIWRNFEETAIDPGECEKSSADVCVLGNIASYIFYHWIEELLKVVVLEDAGFKGFYAVGNPCPRFCFESLALLGVNDDRIITIAKPTIFSKVFFTSRMSLYECRGFPIVIERLRDILHYQVCSLGGTPDRVWAERGGTANPQRDLLNKEEVNNLILKHGFQIVDFGKLNFTRQIQIDRGASVIGGAHGSAMVHCGFMRHNSTVIEAFSANYTCSGIIQLCSVLKHSYHQIVHSNAYLPEGLLRKLGNGKQENQPLLIDLEHLKLVLSKIPQHI